MAARSGYHQNDSSACTPTNSVTSSGTKGRRTRRSVVSRGILSCVGPTSAQGEAGRLGQRGVPARPGGGCVQLVGPEGADGTVTVSPAHDLDPLLACLDVGDVGDERPGGAAHAGAGHLDGIA